MSENPVVPSRITLDEIVAKMTTGTPQEQKVFIGELLEHAVWILVDMHAMRVGQFPNAKEELDVLFQRRIDRALLNLIAFNETGVVPQMYDADPRATAKKEYAEILEVITRHYPEVDYVGHLMTVYARTEEIEAEFFKKANIRKAEEL